MLLKNARRIHIIKTATWRIVASVTTFAIGWAVTGKLTIGLTIGITDVIIKTILYYGHERAWYRFARNRSLQE